MRDGDGGAAIRKEYLAIVLRLAGAATNSTVDAPLLRLGEVRESRIWLKQGVHPRRRGRRGRGSASSGAFASATARGSRSCAPFPRRAHAPDPRASCPRRASHRGRQDLRAGRRLISNSSSTAGRRRSARPAAAAAGAAFRRAEVTLDGIGSPLGGAAAGGHAEVDGRWLRADSGAAADRLPINPINSEIHESDQGRRPGAPRRCPLRRPRRCAGGRRRSGAPRCRRDSSRSPFRRGWRGGCSCVGRGSSSRSSPRD